MLHWLLPLLHRSFLLLRLTAHVRDPPSCRSGRLRHVCLVAAVRRVVVLIRPGDTGCRSGRSGRAA